MSLVTGLAAGVSIEAAVSHGMVGLSHRPRDGTRLAFAVAALAVAVGAVAVIVMYSADSAEAHAAVMKWLLFPASTVWTVAVVWLVAYATGVLPRRFLLALTAVFALMLAIDLMLPFGLLRNDVGTLMPADVAGAQVMDTAHVSPHPLNLVTVILTGVAVGFIFYALAVVLRRGERGKAVYLGVAVLLYALSMVVDTLSDYNVIDSIYTTPLYFAGVVLVTSVALRREALLGEAELRRYRSELEELVQARVADLDMTNEQLADEIVVRRSVEEALRRRIAELDALQHLSQTLAARTDLTSALGQASTEIAVLLHAESARVCLSEGVSDPLASASIPRSAEARADAQASGTRCIAGRGGRAEGAPDLADSVTSHDIGDVLIIPLVARGEVVGVLDVVRAEGSPAFDSEEVQVARTIADSLAAVVENERLHADANVQAAVQERQRLARELHDAVTQSIYSATLIAEALPKVWERDRTEGLRSLETLRRLVNGALAEMRTLLFELRPEALRAAPIDTLLERLGTALEGQIEASVDVTVGEGMVLPDDVKVALYRVAQEALSNIGKHARATRVEVSLVASDDGVTLTVADDGRGFDPECVKPDRMGVRIMGERLRQIGGTVAIESRAGRGTSVVAVWRGPVGDGSVRAEEVSDERLGAHPGDGRG